MTSDRLGSPGRATTIGSSPAGLGELIGALIDDLRASLAARLDIAHIEARQAVVVVLRSFGAACAAVLLVLTAWWALCCALIVLAVTMGIPWMGALIGAAIVNTVLAVGAARYARGRANEIGMPHTRRLLLYATDGRTDTLPEKIDAAVPDR